MDLPPAPDPLPVSDHLPRAEYPRPQLRRDAWLCLNGRWRFAFDDADRGRERRWHAPDGPFGATAGAVTTEGGGDGL